MQYLHHEQAGEATLLLKDEEHRYIFKVRRHRMGESIALRNLKDENIYHYEISYVDKKEANLVLESSERLVVKVNKFLHIGWCLIDPKSIEKILPTLNEIGVKKITFILCQRSQKNFKVDFKRWEKILLNSSQQCGRSGLLEFSICNSLEEFLGEHPSATMLNFSEQRLTAKLNISTMVIGCEGGFTSDEVALFKPENIMGLNTPLILKSESAVCVVASQLLCI